MEHAHHESEYSSSRMNSRYPELSGAKVQPERQEDLSISASSLREPQTSKEETKETRLLLNGYTNHVIISDRADNSSQDENRHRDVDGDENDDDVSHEIKYDNGDDNLNYNDDDAVDGDNNGGDDDNKDDNNDDDGDDDDDDDDNNDGCGGCDYDDGNNNTYAYYHDDYRSQDAFFSREDENVSLLSNRVNESVTPESSSSLRVTSGNDHQTTNTENIVHRPGNNNNNNNISKSSSRNEENSRRKKDYSELFAAGSTTLCTNETNSPTASAAGNFTIQGARPKTSQTPVLDNVNSPGYYSGKIPSLEVTGINQGFLARHTTDQSLPHSSYNGDDGLPASESTSFTNWPQTSITRSDSSTSPWNLPPPPDPERSGLIREDAFSRGIHPRYINPMHGGYQPGAPMTSLGGWPSGWQSPNRHQTHPGRTASYFPSGYQRCYIPNSWLTGAGESSHLSSSGHFPGIAGTQGGSLFNRQAWMPSNYQTTWRWPRYDYSGYQPNVSNFGDFAAWSEPAINSPVVNPPTPTITLATSNLPDAGVRLPATTVRAPLTSSCTSSTGSGSVASNRFPSNAYSSNRQERVGDFSTNSSFASEQQGNHGLPSTETTSSRRQQESLRNNDSLNSSQEGLQTWAPSQDDSLVALERKVAEACAVVERVLKEREERTKKQREALQRHREIRQQREREARERREREEQERREIAEREARERGDMAVEERAPVQESPLWQCEHYQRRCSVRFPCCGVFYPCHRCHNGSGACDADDKKANQATHVKCANCGHEEEINEKSQNCSNCGAKLSEYFCFKCKHFTGVDKNPFHCNKCGICRIYKDRSFHCDVCNVCLDKRLEGKHKCRPDSGHDECCICLEDAFSGCQILPCSHKVHRECAIAMIQNGVRSCPICRHPLYSQGSQ